MLVGGHTASFVPALWPSRAEPLDAERPHDLAIGTTSRMALRTNAVFTVPYGEFLAIAAVGGAVYVPTAPIVAGTGLRMGDLPC